ncbi:MAG: ABC transporter ATP-binding protein [Hyphomonadaceae bacterium]|nr:ABC transporter ATP-binding protein [Hyphomonadaceae bacterium]
MSVNSETQDVVLSVQQVGKLYSRRPSDVRRRLSAAAWRAFLNLKAPAITNKRDREFWAVSNVSFELRRGEAVGIIGLNGSGKTTTLRMLAGQILPDAGRIELTGTSAAMIDLTAGFQRSASGYENIFLRAAALGLNRDQTRQHLDEIVEFCELGSALEAPLVSYSSGMQMRLAFSIMAIVSPDVLLIDEVLAVGDFRFRQKCLGKIREMRARSAFVLVSHSMGDIRNFCDRVLVMHKGNVYFQGEPDEAIRVYEELDADTPSQTPDQKLIAAMGPTFTNDSALELVEHEWVDEHMNVVEQVQFDQAFALRVRLQSNIDLPSITIGIPVWNMNAQYVTGLSTQIQSDAFSLKAGSPSEFLLKVEPGMINPGTIKSMLTVLSGAEFFYRVPNPDLVIGPTGHPTWGAITIPHNWIKLH